MASNQSLVQGQLLERTKVVNLSTVATHPAMQIQYVGSKAYAKITITQGAQSTNLQVYADDVDGATTSYLALDLSTPAATLDTYGELMGVINSYSDLRCFLIGVLPGDLTNNSLLAMSATSITGDNGLTLYTFMDAVLATGVYKAGFSISNQKFTSRPTGGWATKNVGWVTDALCVNSLCYAEITATTSGTVDSTYVYAVNDVDGTSSLMYTSAAYTSATKATYGSTPTPDAPYLVSPRGQRLVVQTASTTSKVTALIEYAIGKTRHLTGGDVPDSNYTGCV